MHNTVLTIDKVKVVFLIQTFQWYWTSIAACQMKIGRQFASKIAFNRSVLLWLPAVYNTLPWPWTIYIDLWLIVF